MQGQCHVQRVLFCCCVVLSLLCCHNYTLSFTSAHCPCTTITLSLCDSHRRSYSRLALSLHIYTVLVYDTVFAHLHCPLYDSHIVFVHHTVRQNNTATTEQCDRTEQHNDRTTQNNTATTEEYNDRRIQRQKNTTTIEQHSTWS